MNCKNRISRTCKKFVATAFTTFIFLIPVIIAQDKSSLVNVFLGTSGDHGQLSPGASSPFHQMDIAPQTYPHLHAGYEHLAKEILGFTHNRFEGVGCQGSGGVILVKPFLEQASDKLIKEQETAGPGYYELSLQNKIQTHIAVDGNFGMHEYLFPKGKKGLLIDLQHALNNAFVSNEFKIDVNNTIVGAVRSKTTCHVGTYTIYYAIQVPHAKWDVEGNLLHGSFPEELKKVTLKIAFSAVSQQYALATLSKHQNQDYTTCKAASGKVWNGYLSHLLVKGDPAREKLFYSLLYRTLQSPYRISEPDGVYRGTDGKEHRATKENRYHGWAIWDNYKTQLPLLELLYPDLFQDIVYSISDLYRYGKYDFAGPHEPANSVRTEHAAVVLLDARNKGYQVPLKSIKDSLIKDTARFDFTKPDKYLEASYDMWAMGSLFPQEKQYYWMRANTWKSVWNKEFKDLSKSDVDRMSARNMYQGTIRQYRWNVPFDIKGLISEIGGSSTFTAQLDNFFDQSYFNRANEPDIQSPTLYYASDKPWRYQSLVQELALDTVIQYYFNDNSRGIDPFIDRIYKNQPKAYIRTMDDDAGAMSGWFVLTAIGLQQPLVGEPIYYLNVPLFPEIDVDRGKSVLKIRVKNFDDKNRYIQRVILDGKDLGRTWIRHEEIVKGKLLEIEAGAEPTAYGLDNRWLSELGTLYDIAEK